jgi:hypothetical protein
MKWSIFLLVNSPNPRKDRSKTGNPQSNKDDLPDLKTVPALKKLHLQRKNSPKLIVDKPICVC